MQPLLRKRLEELGSVSKDEYEDAVVRLSGRTADEAEASLRELVGNDYVALLRPVPVSKNEFIFYFRSKADVLRRLLSLPQLESSYLGRGWAEVALPPYDDWRLVAVVEGERRLLNGKYGKWNGPAAEVQPGDILTRVRVPGVFSGDEPPELSMPAELIALAEIKEAEVPSDREPAAYHYFFLDGLGVQYLDIGSLIEFENAIEIWPSRLFPSDEILFDKLSLYDDDSAGRTPFTAVILLPIEPVTTFYPDVIPIQKRRRDVQRFCTVVDLLYGCRPRIVGDALLTATGPSEYGVAWLGGPRDFPYDAVNSVVRSSGSALKEKEAREAAFVAWKNIPSKTAFNEWLLAFLQRALDSFSFARSLRGDPLALVLVWAGIEALVSSSTSEVMTNVSLALLGLSDADGDKRVQFWLDAKKSYGIRSDIVHAFKLAGYDEIRDTLAFAEHAFLLAAKAAVKECLEKEDTKRKDFAERCRNAALARS